MSIFTDIEAIYPWAAELGLIDFIAGLIRDDASPSEILSKVRQTDEWKTQFPSFYKEDGGKRFSSEADYMSTVENLRDVMKEFGVYDPALEAPGNYSGLLENGVDPNEFRDRFTTYRDLEAGTQELRDAFYIYAGLEISVDDLYEATVNPQKMKEMTEEYDVQVGIEYMNYEQFMTRVTEVSMKNLTEGVNAAIGSGMLAPENAQLFINIDPNVAREWLDVIWSGQAPNPDGTPFMSVADLAQSFQYAMLASAASEQGLALPSQDRLEEFRQAGVTRANAERAYSTYAFQKAGLSGMAQRARVGGIDQSMFEEAAILGDASAQATLRQITGKEQALGQAGEGFGSNLEGGRVVQAGRL
jgi:hypothetical protein